MVCNRYKQCHDATFQCPYSFSWYAWWPSSKPEYTFFNEHGRTFVALDREPDPLTPQSWWQQYKWYFYGSIIGLSLILTCSLCWVCTCANCCLPKLRFNPCIVGYKQSKRLRKKFSKTQLKKHHHGENMETIIQLLPPVSTTVQSTQIKDILKFNFYQTLLSFIKHRQHFVRYKKLNLSVVNQPLAVFLKVARA